MTQVITLICFPIVIGTLLPGLFAQNCFNETDQFYCKLSTKTPYRFIANYNDSQLNYPGKIEKLISYFVQ